MVSGLWDAPARFAQRGWQSFGWNLAFPRLFLNSMESMYVNISGSVQGVGFRYFALQHAKSLGLVGYVKNLVNGSVEIFAQGERERLETYLGRLKAGPNSAYVRETRVTWKQMAQKYERFEVAY